MATFFGGGVNADDIIAEITDSAPATLNTLNELAAALNDDANFASTVTTAIAAKQDSVSGVSSTEIGYLDGVTSAIQTQLDNKLSTSANIGNLSDVANNLSVISGIGEVLTYDGANGWTSSGLATQVSLPANTSIGSVSSTELGYVNNVTSSIQTQLDSKAAKTQTVEQITQSFTLPSGSNGKLFYHESGSDYTVTLNLSSLQIGEKVDFLQVGSGKVTIASGVPGQLILYSDASKRSTNGVGTALSIICYRKDSSDTRVAIIGNLS